MKRSCIACTALGMLLAVCCAAAAQPGPTQEELDQAQRSTEWLLPNHDYAGVRYVDLKQITPVNAGSLRPVCMYQGADLNRALNNPIVYAGVMYVTTLHATVALDPGTCKVKWRHEWKPKAKEGNASIKNRGVAIKAGKLVRGTQDGYLFALDAATGKMLWEVKAADSEKFEALSINPLIYDDLVIIGPSGSEFGIKGWIGAFRLDDGRPVWKFNTIPDDGEPGAETWGAADSRLKGGGGIWTTPALDIAKGHLYVAVGNPAPDIFAGQRPGANLYTNSVVVLDVRTGKLLWHKQAVPHDSHDWDMPVTSPLFGATLSGKERNVATMAAKDGLLRLIDRDSQEQIYSVASQGAKERVKVAFLLQKIAEKEDIKVSQQEIAQRITQLAATYQIPADKFLKDLQKRNGLIEIYDQVMNEKVLDFLQQHAQIEDVPPGSEIPGSNPS